MKTIKKISILLVLTMFYLVTEAKNNEVEAIVKTEFLSIEKIADAISYPELAKARFVEGEVCTSIKVDAWGNVEVTAINGHPTLIESVKEQLEKLKLTKTQHEQLLKLNFEIL